MKNNKSEESRRKLLKSIAVGSGAVIAGKGLPENWTKPVVDSVLLPAHALTSSSCTPATFTFEGAVGTLNPNNNIIQDAGNLARLGDAINGDAIITFTGLCPDQAYNITINGTTDESTDDGNNSITMVMGSASLTVDQSVGTEISSSANGQVTTNSQGEVTASVTAEGAVASGHLHAKINQITGSLA